MKKFLITLLITGLVFGTQVYAQHGHNGLPKPPVPGKTPPKPKPFPGQPPKPNVVKPNKPVPPPVPPSDQGKGQDKAKDNQGKGNAYGKDKEGLEGKEFGQHRAAEAKSKQEAITVSESKIDQTVKTNEDTRTKIKEAKEKLELKKKEKKITDAEYAKKKKELDDLETQVNELDKKNAELKGKLSKESEVKQK
ncbi:MAG TPA: hypothetical protein PKN48_09480 [Bacteroidales bacterium]|nr:hypothetical protein [Bacteroidales bacterium]